MMNQEQDSDQDQEADGADDESAPKKVKNDGRWECRGCEYRSDIAWNGIPCPNCGHFFNIIQRRADKSSARQISRLAFKPRPRIPTGVDGFDRALGGPDGKGRYGLVAGNVVLLSGRRGGGKSTLSVWSCGNMIKRGKHALYCSGEETREDIAEIFGRQGVFEGLDEEAMAHAEERLDVLGNEGDLFKILNHAEQTKPDIMVIDSMQTVQCDDVKADFGSHAQVTAVVNMVTSFSKRTKIPVIVISQLAGSGEIAGGQGAQHNVDAIYQLNRLDDRDFEQMEREGADIDDAMLAWRVLRCDEKNRRGDADAVYYFEMMGKDSEHPGRLRAVQKRGRLRIA